jgi:hypothetical protein
MSILLLNFCSVWKLIQCITLHWYEIHPVISVDTQTSHSTKIGFVLLQTKHVDTQIPYMLITCTSLLHETMLVQTIVENVRSWSASECSDDAFCAWTLNQSPQLKQLVALDVTVEWLVFLFCICKTLDSHLGLIAGYPVWRFYVYLSPSRKIPK